MTLTLSLVYSIRYCPSSPGTGTNSNAVVVIAPATRYVSTAPPIMCSGIIVKLMSIGDVLPRAVQCPNGYERRGVVKLVRGGVDYDGHWVLLCYGRDGIEFPRKYCGPMLSADVTVRYLDHVGLNPRGNLSIHA